MGMYYVADNHVLGSTITTSDDAAPNPIYGNTDYLSNRRQSLPYRFTAKVDNWIKIDLGADTKITFAGLFNHNFSGVTVKLRANSALSGDLGNLLAWQTGPVDFGPVTINHKAHNMGRWDFDKTLRWWHIEVQDAANAVMPDIGELVLQKWHTFTMNYKWPYSQGMKRALSDNETYYGQRWRSQLSKKKLFRIDFDAVTDANMEAEVEAFFEAVGGAAPFVFIPESSETELWYMNIMNSEEAANNFKDLNAWALELEEQAWGIVLL